MTKKLEELFSLKSDDEESASASIEQTIASSTLEEMNISSIISVDTLSSIEKVELALPQVRGLESTDQEMDELATAARTAFDTLMELGMQVESRFSAEIFNSASSMLGHAITAKTAKVNKKLKSIELQLKKIALEQKINDSNKNRDDSNTIPGQAIDRNALIKMMLSQKSGQITDQ